MGRRYVFVRMPKEVYDQYKKIKVKMEVDIQKYYGKRVPMTMPKVFKAISSPEYNENFIQIDIKNLVSLARKKRGVL